MDRRCSERLLFACASYTSTPLQPLALLLLCKCVSRPLTGHERGENQVSIALDLAMRSKAAHTQWFMARGDAMKPEHACEITTPSCHAARQARIKTTIACTHASKPTPLRTGAETSLNTSPPHVLRHPPFANILRRRNMFDAAWESTEQYFALATETR